MQLLGYCTGHCHEEAHTADHFSPLAYIALHWYLFAALASSSCGLTDALNVQWHHGCLCDAKSAGCCCPLCVHQRDIQFVCGLCYPSSKHAWMVGLVSVLHPMCVAASGCRKSRVFCLVLLLALHCISSRASAFER